MGAPVVHFEIYGKDAAALRGFYEQLFGWEIHADNPMNYGMVHTQADGKGIEGGVAEGDARVNVVIEVDVSRRTWTGPWRSAARSSRQ